MTSYPELLVSISCWSQPCQRANGVSTNAQREHTSLPAFSPLIPTSLLQPLAFTSFGLAFVLAFYFTTCDPFRARGERSLELTTGTQITVQGVPQGGAGGWRGGKFDGRVRDGVCLLCGWSERVAGRAISEDEVSCPWVERATWRSWS